MRRRRKPLKEKGNRRGIFGTSYPGRARDLRPLCDPTHLPQSRIEDALPHHYGNGYHRRLQKVSTTQSQHHMDRTPLQVRKPIIETTLSITQRTSRYLSFSYFIDNTGRPSHDSITIVRGSIYPSPLPASKSTAQTRPSLARMNNRSSDQLRHPDSKDFPSHEVVRYTPATAASKAADNRKVLIKGYSEISMR